MPNEPGRRSASLLVIGDPESRRMSHLLEAAAQAGLGSRAVSYADWLARRSDFEPDQSEQWCRIEAPGSDPQTMRTILKRGEPAMEERRLVPVTADEIEQDEFGRGRIMYPLQWYLGFRQILEDLARWGSKLSVRWMNSPQAVAVAFDKQQCRNLWSESDVPIPSGFEGIRRYDGLRAAVPERHARLFIKLRYGFSAMGAVALEWRDSLVRAITTVETCWHAGRPRMYVSKKPRVLQREFEIAWLIDTLAMEEIVVEEWLSKARWRGKPFDLRIVVIDGRARHTVGRAHASPFTNLNLDAERIDHEAVSQRLGNGWPLLTAAAERAARQIQGAFYLGMDILVRPCRRRCAVLEANAFGDYLPGLLENGESTYLAELRSYLNGAEQP
jgi:hypothetical protein